MMPDLGKYAVSVLSAYGVSLLLVVGIVMQSWWRSQRMKHRLDAAEARRRAKNG